MKFLRKIALQFILITVAIIIIGLILTRSNTAREYLTPPGAKNPFEESN